MNILDLTELKLQLKKYQEKYANISEKDKNDPTKFGPFAIFYRMVTLESLIEDLEKKND